MIEGNPTLLVAMFDTDLSATDRDGATAFTVDAGTPSIVDGKLHLDGSDAVSIPSAGHGDPLKGSLTFPFIRLSDTGGAEILHEFGTDGSGTDYLTLGVDASDHFVMTWTADGGADSTVQSVQSIAIDTVYFISCAWQHTTITLSVTDDMSTQVSTGTRDVPQGSWGVGDLVLEAA